MKCSIVKDLFPSYIDGLTSADSNAEIEEHLQTCQECKNILDQMKTEVSAEIVELNKKNIKPFKKLNKRMMQSVLITLAACILIVGSYFYFFGIGWKVDSSDMNITYSYKEDTLWIDFELTNGRVLTAWTEHKKTPVSISFTECFSSVLDDRGKYPNQFSYGIQVDENTKPFSDEDCIILRFKDKTDTLYLKEIVEELELQ